MSYMNCVVDKVIKVHTQDPYWLPSPYCFSFTLATAATMAWPPPPKTIDNLIKVVPLRAVALGPLKRPINHTATQV